MGTHSDGKPVTKAGFDGSYWAVKAKREQEAARKAREIERRSAAVESPKEDEA